MGPHLGHGLHLRVCILLRGVTVLGGALQHCCARADCAEAQQLLRE